MKRSEIVKIINSIIGLSEILNLACAANEGCNEEIEEVMDLQIQQIYNTQNELIELVSIYTGVSENDFIGDGWFNFCDDVFSGKYDADEILNMFESVNINGQRQWLIEYNLGLLIEYDRNIKRNIDTDRSKKIFKARIHVLLEQTDVPANRKVEYTKMLLDYVNGNLSKDYILEKYNFYINN